MPCLLGGQWTWILYLFPYGNPTIIITQVTRLYLSHYLPKYSKSKESRMNFVSFSLCIMATPQPLSPKWLDYTYHTTYLSTLKVKKAGMEWKKFQHIMPIANHTLIHLCHNIFTMVRSKDIMQYYYYVDLLERLQLHFCMHF